MFGFLKRDKEGGDASPPADGLVARLRQGLAATRARLGGQVAALLPAGRKIDEALYEELESALLSCDVGFPATQYLLDETRTRVRRGQFKDAVEVRAALKAAMLDLLSPLEAPLETRGQHPFVILLAGVNGAGKTTTIGKLSKRFLDAGQSVLLAAGDTFRAAARDQLKVWGERNGVTVISQEGSDAAAVIFDAVQSAKARQINVVIADTAGRLPTQLHLMEELKKVKRVIDKSMPGAPHEVLLVLDANNGQNVVSQVKAFDEALGVTGLILTKLDGTAKGGAIAAIARHKAIPLRFIGVGESIDDLRPFVAKEFVDAMLD
jgi:fused signal recognition particle receptor